MKKDPRVYLAQILERIDRISEYTADGKKAFFADQRTQDAVIRNPNDWRWKPEPSGQETGGRKTRDQIYS